MLYEYVLFIIRLLSDPVIDDTYYLIKAKPRSIEIAVDIRDMRAFLIRKYLVNDHEGLGKSTGATE
jgi:hypothetical protein